MHSLISHKHTATASVTGDATTDPCRRSTMAAGKAPPQARTPAARVRESGPAKQVLSPGVLRTCRVSSGTWLWGLRIGGRLLRDLSVSSGAFRSLRTWPFRKRGERADLAPPQQSSAHPLPLSALCSRKVYEFPEPQNPKFP